MRKMTYIAGAAVVALAGLGIYASEAQNAGTNNNADTGVLVIEEESYTPEQNNGMRAENPNRMQNTGAFNNSQNPRQGVNDGLSSGNNSGNMNSRANMNNPSTNTNTAPNKGFENLPDNPGVEVAPDNQPVVSKAMKNQNPNYNNGNAMPTDTIIEEDMIETAE